MTFDKTWRRYIVLINSSFSCSYRAREYYLFQYLCAPIFNNNYLKKMILSESWEFKSTETFVIFKINFLTDL